MKLEAIIEQLKDEKFADYVALNPPISLEEILEAEKDLPFPLPEFYKEFLQLANGGKFAWFGLAGIHPSNRQPAEILHPRTLSEFKNHVLSMKKKARFRPWRGTTSLQELLDGYYNLVHLSTAQYLDSIDFGFGKIEYVNKLIAIGWTAAGDVFVVKENDDTVYTWFDNSSELDGEEYGVFVSILEDGLQFVQERYADQVREKSVWEKIYRWSRGY